MTPGRTLMTAVGGAAAPQTLHICSSFIYAPLLYQQGQVCECVRACEHTRPISFRPPDTAGRRHNKPANQRGIHAQFFISCGDLAPGLLELDTRINSPLIPPPRRRQLLPVTLLPRRCQIAEFKRNEKLNETLAPGSLCWRRFSRGAAFSALE